MITFTNWLDNYFESKAASDVLYNEVSKALSEQPSSYSFPFDKNVWVNQAESLFLKCSWLAKPLVSKNIGREKIVMWMNGDKMAWFITDKTLSKWLFYVEQSSKDHQILRSIKNGSSVSYYSFLKNIIEISNNEIMSGEPMTAAVINTWKKIISNKNSKFKIFDKVKNDYVNEIPNNLFSSQKFVIFVSEIG